MNEPMLRQFRALLTSQGHRVTTPRIRLFTLLIDSPPLSVGELLERAEHTLDRVGVYRNIELFEALGIFRRIPIGWKYKLELSDVFIGHHHHLSCVSCGALVEIKDHQQLEHLMENIAREQGFVSLRHHIELEGYCRNCHAQ